jgi:hypothetical protein
VQTNSGHDPLIRRLESISKLSDEERDALRTLPLQVFVIDRDQDVVRRRSPVQVLPDPGGCGVHLQGDGAREAADQRFPASR